MRRNNDDRKGVQIRFVVDDDKGSRSLGRGIENVKGSRRP